MPQTVVYVSCAAEGVIAAFRLDSATGALTPLGRTAVPGPVDPPPASMPLALSPDRRMLYAAGRNPPFPVASFAIGKTGALTLTGTGHLPAAMAYIATDRSGRFLFGASYHAAKLSVTPIGVNGVPGEPLQVLDTQPKPHSILPDPANNAVYAAVLGGDAILRQAFCSVTGRLATPATPVAHTAPGAGPRHLRFARGGALLYVVNELDGTLNAYARDPATGALTDLQSVRLVPPAAPGETLAAADLHLTPDERFLYASERVTNILAGFRLRPDGRLDAIGSVPAEAVPRGFAIDPSGSWLLCAGQQTGRVAVWSISGSGALSRLGDYRAGDSACWVEIINLPEAGPKSKQGQGAALDPQGVGGPLDPIP
jgi:6-phosphogluconolactonase